MSWCLAGTSLQNSLTWSKSRSGKHPFPQLSTLSLLLMLHWAALPCWCLHPPSIAVMFLCSALLKPCLQGVNAMDGLKKAHQPEAMGTAAKTALTSVMPQRQSASYSQVLIHLFQTSLPNNLPSCKAFHSFPEALDISAMGRAAPGTLSAIFSCTAGVSTPISPRRHRCPTASPQSWERPRGVKLQHPGQEQGKVPGDSTDLPFSPPLTHMFLHLLSLLLISKKQMSSVRKKPATSFLSALHLLLHTLHLTALQSTALQPDVTDPHG